MSTPRDTFSALDFMTWVLINIGNQWAPATEVDITAGDPTAFDTSELVAWGAGQVGVYIPRGANAQIAYAEERERLIPVDMGVRLRGAILWTPGRMAISLGMRRTIESANGRVSIVRNVTASRFEKAAKIPGVKY